MKASVHKNPRILDRRIIAEPLVGNGSVTKII
jgi:hypothetical protein